MTDRLKLYNGALRKIGETRLANLIENVKSRRALDNVYDEVVAGCLEAGWWNFAIRSAKLESTPSAETEFGREFIYDRPDDWVKTYSFCSDEHFYSPILDYQEIGSRWVTDYNEIYVQWVSNGTEYGLDLGRWPQSFITYVQYALAFEICEDITGSSSKMEELFRLRKIAESDAKNSDALNDPVTRFPPAGRLVSSRGNGSGLRNREGRYRSG